MASFFCSNIYSVYHLTLTLSQRKWCAIHDEDRNRLQYWILRFQYLELGSEIMFAEINVGGGRNDTDTPE